MPEESGARNGPGWTVAEQVAAAARRRYPAEVLAVGVQGALAHGDESPGGDVDLVLVTYRSGTGPGPAVRRVDGILVDLSTIGAEEYLQHARTLSTSWPLTADRYLNTRPVYDPQGWFRRLRDTHLGRLADARQPEFTALARQAWCRGASAHARALRLAEWYDTDAALLLLGEARLAAATVAGLLSRTYFRDSVDAVRRTGTADADMTRLGALLAGQADELADRGRPVDGPVSSLFE